MSPLLAFVNQVSDHVLSTASNFKVDPDCSDLVQLLDPQPCCPLSATSLEVASLIDHNPSQFDGENLNIDTPPLPGDFLPNPASKLSSQILQYNSPHLGLLAEHSSLPTTPESYNNSSPPQTLEESDPPETDALLPLHLKVLTLQ